MMMVMMMTVIAMMTFKEAIVSYLGMYGIGRGDEVRKESRLVRLS